MAGIEHPNIIPKYRTEHVELVAKYICWISRCTLNVSSLRHMCVLSD